MAIEARSPGQLRPPLLRDLEGSKYGIDEWLEIKYLAIGGIDDAANR